MNHRWVSSSVRQSVTGLIGLYSDRNRIQIWFSVLMYTYFCWCALNIHDFHILDCVNVYLALLAGFFIDINYPFNVLAGYQEAAFLCLTALPPAILYCYFRVKGAQYMASSVFFWFAYTSQSVSRLMDVTVYRTPSLIFQTFAVLLVWHGFLLCMHNSEKDEGNFRVPAHSGVLIVFLSLIFSKAYALSGVSAQDVRFRVLDAVKSLSSNDLSVDIEVLESDNHVILEGRRYKVNLMPGKKVDFFKETVYSADFNGAIDDLGSGKIAIYMIPDSINTNEKSSSGIIPVRHLFSETYPGWTMFINLFVILSGWLTAVLLASGRRAGIDSDTRRAL